jgi:hypothetical protein
VVAEKVEENGESYDCMDISLAFLEREKSDWRAMIAKETIGDV